MSKEELIENWQRIIAEQEASGMTPRAFCLNNDINLWRFYLWRQRVREHTAGGFLQLLPAKDCRCTGTDAGIRIHLNNTFSIELAKGFDPSALRCVVDTLEPVPGSTVMLSLTSATCIYLYCLPCDMHKSDIIFKPNLESTFLPRPRS